MFRGNGEAGRGVGGVAVEVLKSVNLIPCVLSPPGVLALRDSQCPDAVQASGTEKAPGTTEGREGRGVGMSAECRGVPAPPQLIPHLPHPGILSVSLRGNDYFHHFLER